MKTAKDYYSDHMVAFEEFPCTSGLTIHPLDLLIGKPWDDLALGYVHAINPTSIRVTTGGIKLDASLGRVTVVVDDNNIITGLSQEVTVGLPEGVEHGEAMGHALAFGGIDSEQCKWHLDAEGYVMFGINGDYYKRTKDGLVPFPRGDEE